MSEEEKKGEVTPEQAVALITENAQNYLFGAFDQIQDQIRRSKFKNILAHTPSYGRRDNSVGLVSQMANPPLIQTFIDASPAVLSSLVPRIEFFFAERKNGKLVETPFEFSDHVSGRRMVDTAKKLRGQLQVKKDETSILDANTKGSQVGIQEFVWMFDNKHEGDKTLKASVKLFFANAQELLSKQFLGFIFNANNAKDLVRGSNKKDQVLEDIQKRFKTMGDGNLGAAAENNKTDAKKSFKQLKIKIGWSVPQRVNDPAYYAGMSPNEIETFKKAVAATQKTILLNFTKYKLEFGQQGQVTVNIEYVGSLDSLLSDADASDIFSRVSNDPKTSLQVIPISTEAKPGMLWGVNNTGRKLVDIAYGSGGKKRTANDAYDAGTRADSSKDPKQTDLFGGSGASKGYIFKQLKAQPQKDPYTGQDGFNISLAAVEYEEKTLRMAKQYCEENNNKSGKKYAKLIERLDKGLEACKIVRATLEKRTQSQRHSMFINSLFNSGKARFVIAKKKTLTESSPETATSQGSAVDIVVGKLDRQGIQDRKQAFSEATRAKVRESSGLEAEDTMNALQPGGVTAQDRKNKAGETKVVFFTVGDILDIASTDASFSRPPLMEIMDASIILGSFNGSAVGLTNNKNANFCIADIPINFEWFAQWFLDNYTGLAAPPAKISIRSFINKLLTKLVAPLMNDALGSSDNEVNVGFSMTTLTYPKVSNTDLRQITRPQGGRFGSGVVKRISKAASANKAMVKRGESRTFFIIFCTIKDPGKLNGDALRDKQSGIFHLTLGADRGIVKSFAFSEKKIPQLRAMHIEANSQGSALILPQDVELTLVGNTFFRNGSIIFINGDFAFGKELARKLGIGGYYVVVKSENTINPSTFETRLTCMFLQRAGS